MGLNHSIAVCFFCVAVSVQAQWREWDNPKTAVEDVAHALFERLESTYYGYSSARTTRQYAVKLTPGASTTNVPYEWYRDYAVERETQALIHYSYQTSSWKVVAVTNGVTTTNTVTEVYPLYRLDYSRPVTTNIGGTVVTGMWKSITYVDVPTNIIYHDYMVAVDKALSDVVQQFVKYPSNTADLASKTGTNWFWASTNTAQGVWREDSFAYTNTFNNYSTLTAARDAGLFIWSITNTIDLGTNYPKTVTNSTYLYGWQIGKLDVYSTNRKDVVVVPRFNTTNVTEHPMYRYASMSETSRYVLARASSVRDTAAYTDFLDGDDWIWIDHQYVEGRGFGNALDGIWQYENDWSGGAFYGYSKDSMRIPLSAPSLIFDYEPTPDQAVFSNAVYAGSGPFGCFRPIDTTSGDSVGEIVPAAGWKTTIINGGFFNVLGDSYAVQPEPKAVLTVSSTVTSEVWCSDSRFDFDEPVALPEPINVLIVGQWARPASATQGITQVQSTATVAVTECGQFDLPFNFDSITELNVSCSKDPTNVYYKDGVVVEISKTGFTSVYSRVNASFAWQDPAKAPWYMWKPALEDRKALLNVLQYSKSRASVDSNLVSTAVTGSTVEEYYLFDGIPSGTPISSPGCGNSDISTTQTNGEYASASIDWSCNYTKKSWANPVGSNIRESKSVAINKNSYRFDRVVMASERIPSEVQFWTKKTIAARQNWHSYRHKTVCWAENEITVETDYNNPDRYSVWRRDDTLDTGVKGLNLSATVGKPIGSFRAQSSFSVEPPSLESVKLLVFTDSFGPLECGGTNGVTGWTHFNEDWDGLGRTDLSVLPIMKWGFQFSAEGNP